MMLLCQRKQKFLLCRAIKTLFLHETIGNCSFSSLIFKLYLVDIARGKSISKITRGTLDQSAYRLDSNNTPYMSTEVLCVELAFHRG